MVRVSIEVRNRATHFRVGVQAPSIQRAVSLAKTLYSTADVRVIFPIDLESFFIEDALGAEGLIERGKPQEVQELAA